MSDLLLQFTFFWECMGYNNYVVIFETYILDNDVLCADKLLNRALICIIRLLSDSFLQIKLWQIYPVLLRPYSGFSIHPKEALINLILEESL